MIVFDVDGTLVGGEVHDWRCFAEAFEAAAGFALDSEFFLGLEEVTAKAIVHKALAELGEPERHEVESRVCREFAARLRDTDRSEANAFPAMDGAIELLADIRRRGIPLAIATGDWFETITIKLGAAGISIDDIPIVTASDHFSRAEIIASAIERAGGSLEESIYIGDGPWDWKATRTLGIGFIGCGSKREQLKECGAVHFLETLMPEAFWPLYEKSRS